MHVRNSQDAAYRLCEVAGVLLGHTDPKLTISVYQQVLDMAGEAPMQLADILGCDLEDAFTVLAGRSPRRRLPSLGLPADVPADEAID